MNLGAPFSEIGYHKPHTQVTVRILLEFSAQPSRGRPKFVRGVEAGERLPLGGLAVLLFDLLRDRDTEDT